MWRSKKLIISVVLATMVLVGSIGGIVLAADNGDDSQPKTILDRVTHILVGQGVNITSEQLKDAITQVQSDIRTEALESHLRHLVEKDKITQEQADEYLEWRQSKPDVSFGFGPRKHHGFHGMGKIRGWAPKGQVAAPTQTY